MPAPSKNYTNIPDSKIDAESPVTEELMTWLRDNIVHLREWVGKDYTAAQNHDHDGVNSKTVSVGGSSFQFNTPQVVKVSGGTATSYTDVSISTNTPAGVAKSAILYVDAIWGSGSPVLYLRKNGASGDQMSFNVGVSGRNFSCIVPLDNSEIFEYKWVGSGSVTLTLLGYVL